jgi:hypothetical protein
VGGGAAIGTHAREATSTQAEQVTR